MNLGIEGAKGLLPHIPMEHRVHPAGAPGVKISLEEVAKRIMKGRLDPLMRAWTIHVLKKGGNPDGNMSKAQLVLDALRERCIFVQDPTMSEYMQNPTFTLCLDDNGICFKGGDCDDISIAYGSAISSIGIDVRVIGQSFDKSGTPSHVLVAIKDSFGDWQRVDATHKTFRVGQFHPFTKEVWIDPMNPSGTAITSTDGDFVGVGAEPKTGLVTGILYNSVVGDTANAVKQLEDSINSLGEAINTITEFRKKTRPDNPYDPEAPGSFVIDASTLPTNSTWTKSAAIFASQQYALGKEMIKAGYDALNGARKLFISDDGNDIFIEKVSGDTFALLPLAIFARTIDTLIGVFFGPAGEILNGFDVRTGKFMSKEEIERLKADHAVGVGAWPAAVVALVAAAAALAITSVSLCYAVSKQADAAVRVAQAAADQAAIDCINKASTIEEKRLCKEALATMGKNRVDFEKAASSNLIKDATEMLTWLVIGGAVAAGAVIALPLVKEAVASAQHKRERPSDAR